MDRSDAHLSEPMPACGRKVKPKENGFTIIELLASMAILIFIVLMMTRLFADATTIWSLGAKRITTATEGRAIMDFIVTEMTQAMADEVLTFKINSGASTEPPLYGVSAYGAESDELTFVGAVQAGNSYNKRNVDQFSYFIAPMLDENENEMTNRYRLARTRRTTSMFTTADNRSKAAYRNEDWWQNNMQPNTGFFEEADNTGQGCETIAENVSAFEIWTYSEKTDGYEPSYYSRNHDDLLPLWADVYLEILGEEDAERASILWEQDQQLALEYIARTTKRFTTRVFFPNRERARAFQ